MVLLTLSEREIQYKVKQAPVMTHLRLTCTVPATNIPCSVCEPETSSTTGMAVAIDVVATVKKSE